MLLKPPTAQQLSDTFARILTAVYTGQLSGCPTDTGLDAATVVALDDVATATDKLVAVNHARQVFAKQEGA